MGERESPCASIEKDHQCCPAKKKDKDHQCKDLVIDIPNDLEPVLWSQCCIYQVPRKLRKLNEEAYTPQLISIGPLHYGNETLATMEKQKLIYLGEFCERTKKTWKDFVSIFKKDDEENIRRCYAEKSELCCSEYVKMIILDAVFIIELFLRVIEKKKEGLHQEDSILKKEWLVDGIEQDLVLLENQLPYFVLDDLYNSAFPAKHELTFLKLTQYYFRDYNPLDMIIPDQTKVLHFTDLLRNFMSHTHPNGKHNLHEFKNLYSAAKLHEAGVKFTVKEACLTDIKFDFKKGELTMPKFRVNDSTECFMRNLMTLEQCHYPFEAYICNYISLMYFLINTAKDVDLLVEKGVIFLELGNNEAVAELVNKLYTNITQNNFCYADIYLDLNKYYEKCWPRFKATLVGVYFSSFWRGTSSVAAVVLLVLTLLQTISSFLPNNR